MWHLYWCCMIKKTSFDLTLLQTVRVTIHYPSHLILYLRKKYKKRTSLIHKTYLAVAFISAVLATNGTEFLFNDSFHAAVGRVFEPGCAYHV